jgi:hypothetical protein
MAELPHIADTVPAAPKASPLCQKRSNAVQYSPDEPRLQIEPFNDVDNWLIRGWELEGLVVVLKHIVPHVALETPLTYGHNAP